MKHDETLYNLLWLPSVFRCRKCALPPGQCLRFAAQPFDKSPQHAENLFNHVLQNLKMPPGTQASWLADVSKEDIDNYHDPTGKVQSKVMFFKYSANLAASRFDQKMSGKE